jgi:hypothetical protein
MNTLKSAAISLSLIALGPGCSTTQSSIANQPLLLSPCAQTPHEAPVLMWGIECKKLGQNRYRIDLRQRQFAVGGDGEAQQIFHRAAEALAEENGFSGYAIIAYTEGIEAGPLLGQRVSRGVVLLTSADKASVSR